MNIASSSRAITPRGVAAAGEADADAVAIVLEAFEPPAEPEDARRQPLGQDALQLRATEADGETPPRLRRRAVEHLEEAAVDVDDLRPLDRHPGVADRLGKTEPLENLERVRRQGNPGADGLEDRRRLEDPCVETAGKEGDGGRQAADAAAVVGFFYGIACWLLARCGFLSLEDVLG